MPSDTPIYRDGSRLRVTRRAYDQIYKQRGWRLRPPKPKTPPAAADGEPGDQPVSTQED